MINTGRATTTANDADALATIYEARAAQIKARQDAQRRANRLATIAVKNSGGRVDLTEVLSDRDDDEL